MRFLVKGKYKQKDRWQKFAREVEANSREEAIRLIYSIIGGNHKVKKYWIKIEEVEEIAE